jgi:hypothetical protein
MKKREWSEGIDHIDPALVEEYVEKKDRLKKTKSRKGVWLRIGAIAACLVLIVGAIVIIPIGDTARYSAEDIAKLFDSMATDAVSTNAYTKVYVPDVRFLYVDEIPDGKYLGVYEYNGKEHELNRHDFETFIDGFLPKLEASLHVDLPQYEIEEERGYREDSLSARIDGAPYYIRASQYETHQSFLLYAFSNNGDRRIILDGETVQVDQRLSDEKMTDSLQTIKNRLFDIFNVSYADTKIIRRFGSTSKHGAERIYVYFYDQNEHPLNSTLSKPISDYICIAFDNFSNYADDIVSDDILSVSDIQYIQRRDAVKEEYALVANAKRISLEQAEALLYQGYVFGGHSCPLCMALQDKISFEDYDFVDIEYIFGHDSQANKATLGMPFYAFYKRIGMSENGNSIYAKTYVAAIEVDGYEEYFKAQEEDHRDEDADLIE